MVDREEIDLCLEAFQDALRRGRRPALDDFLPAGPSAPIALVELVHIELEFRLKHGEPARVEEYLTRYPQLANDSTVLAELALAEFEFRRRREGFLDAESYLQRFPACREILAPRLLHAATLKTGRFTDEDRTLPRPLLEPDIPERLNVPGYEILEELGRGASGIVYKARQVALNRFVALKILHASWRNDPEHRGRFRKEVETIALLHYPNIVQVYDVGEHEGRPFFTMEFLDGGSVAEHCRGRPQPPKIAAELVETLARAMHAVHLKGIVHRDLKPSNILRTAEGCPKITDFGLARREVSDLTATGAVLGTPSYMAPEQAAGKTREIGPAADVYALGAILYELLTGRPPFGGLSVMEVVRQVQDSDPLPPRCLEARTPRAVETICLKCLRKEPHRRYASAAELADDLRRFRNGEAIRARPPAWPERALHGVKRRPTLAVVLATLVLAAVAVPLALLEHTLRLQEALGRARKAEELARRHESEARIAHFAADLKLASTLFNRGDVFQLTILLDSYQHLGDAADDPRGFAWHYLRQHSQKARPASAAYDGPLHLLAYSAAGQELIGGGGGPYNQSLQVWHVQTGRSRWRQSLHENPVALAHSAHSRQGALLAGVTKPREVGLWDLASGQAKFLLTDAVTARQAAPPPHRLADEVREIALSPDGRWLALRDDFRITICDAATGRKQSELPTLSSARLAFAPAGDLLLVSGAVAPAHALQWWHAPTATLRKQHPTPLRWTFLSFSPSGTFLLLIDADGQGAIWDTKECIPLHWSWQIGRVRSLALSADEQTLAAGDDEGFVRLWDVAAGRWRARYRWQPSAIVALTFSPDDRSLAAATAEGNVHQLDATVHNLPHSLTTSAHKVNGPLAWSPDGETVAVAVEGGMVHLLDRRTGQVRRVLRCPIQDVRCLAFSPDGNTLATSCAGERIVRLWNTADGRLRRVTAPQSKEIAFLAFSFDGRLATVDGNTVRFWDTAAGTACGELATDQPIQTLAFTPDGRSLLTAGSSLQLWDLPSGKPSSTKPALRVPVESPIVCLAVSRDGRRLVTSEANGSVRLWRLSAGRQLTPVSKAPVSAGGDRGLGFTPDSQSVFVCHSGSFDESSFWDPPADSCRLTLHGAGGTMKKAALSPDGRTVATVGDEGVVRLWETANGRTLHSAGQTLARVTSLFFSADGRELFTVSRPVGGIVHARRWSMRFHGATLAGTAESLRLWDAASGREKPINLPSRQTMALPHVAALSPDGRLLAAGAEDGSIHIWDRLRGEWHTRLFVSDKARHYAEMSEAARNLWSISDPEYRIKSESVAALAFAPDGCSLAVAGAQGSFRVWAIDDWKERCSWRNDPPSSPWLAFTPDSNSIVGSRGGQIHVWDARTGHLQSTQETETDSPIYCGAFIPTTDILAFGSKDGTIRLWDRHTGEVKRLPGQHQDRVTTLAFTPDGKTLASAGWDRTVRLWNLRAQREVAALEGHKGRINALAFSPDGQTLASGGELDGGRGEVLLWR